MKLNILLDQTSGESQILISEFTEQSYTTHHSAHVQSRENMNTEPSCSQIILFPHKLMSVCRHLHRNEG